MGDRIENSPYIVHMNESAVSIMTAEILLDCNYTILYAKLCLVPHFITTDLAPITPPTLVVL